MKNPTVTTSKFHHASDITLCHPAIRIDEATQFLIAPRKNLNANSNASATVYNVMEDVARAELSGILIWQTHKICSV